MLVVVVMIVDNTNTGSKLMMLLWIIELTVLTVMPDMILMTDMKVTSY